MEIYSALVTGANRGIGLEFVRQITKLISPPKHVFATYRNEKGLEALREIQQDATGTVVHLLQMDVTNVEDVKNIKAVIEDVVAENGLTLLINNAGIAMRGEFPNITEKSMKLSLKVNTVGPVMIFQELYPLLKRAAENSPQNGMSFSRAAVLNLSSFTGSIQKTAVEFIQDVRCAPYKMSKAALNMAMRTISATVKNDNILVVMMCPGWVKTDMGTDRALFSPEESISAMLQTLAKLSEKDNGVFMDRFGNPYPF